jgi:hypothetical protein
MLSQLKPVNNAADPERKTNPINLNKEQPYKYNGDINQTPNINRASMQNIPRLPKL